MEPGYYWVKWDKQGRWEPAELWLADYDNNTPRWWKLGEERPWVVPETIGQRIAPVKEASPSESQ